MAIVDYASLQTAILAWKNRTGDSDATSQVTTWIQLAEDQIAAKMALSPLSPGETVNTALTIASEYTALPTGFVKLRGLKLNLPNPVEYIAPNVVERYTAITGTNDQPIFYTIQGNQLRVIPVPDSSYTGTLTYWGISPLSGTNTTNWLITARPTIYLFAALAQADAYYDDADAFEAHTALWEGLWDKLYGGSGPSAAGGSLQMRTDNGNP